jgi:hypothetical protein
MKMVTTRLVMQKWEYCLLQNDYLPGAGNGTHVILNGKRSRTGECGLEHGVYQLELLGHEGWEVVSQSEYNDRMTWTLKRGLSEN